MVEIFGILITVPCCLDIPYLLSGDLVEVTGEVTQGSMSEKTVIVKEEYILEMIKREKNIC